MKKFLVSVAVIFGFSAYALRGQFPQLGEDDDAPPVNLNTHSILQSTNTSTGLLNANTAIVENTNNSANDNTNISQPTNTSPPVTNTNTSTPINTNTAPVVTTGKFTDGQYTGSVADAFYGNVQVVATISGGKLTKVVAVQYPNSHGHSIEINRFALPRLQTEAISAQSAEIDIVSGATYTSLAYRESLQAALTSAAK